MVVVVMKRERESLSHDNYFSALFANDAREQIYYAYNFL